MVFVSPLSQDFFYLYVQGPEYERDGSLFILVSGIAGNAEFVRYSVDSRIFHMTMKFYLLNGMDESGKGQEKMLDGCESMSFKRFT